MGRIRQFLGLEESTVVASAVTRAQAAENQLELLNESVADLELMLEDRGWERLTTQADTEFTRDGLGRAAKVARVMAVQNPLIKRGLGVRAAYIWGQGVQIQARAGQDDGQDVNAVVQAFLDDPGNKAALTGDQAHETLERALGTDGNVFLACFTSPLTGRVQVRSIPFDEITDVIANPDDKDDPWYYKRVWNQTTVSLDGRVTTSQQTAFYPSLRYRPLARPKTVNGAPVYWDSPIKHVKVNELDGWSFGIGDAYAALSWARAYRDFLADWATLVKALSQFAWKATSANGSKAARLRQAIARRPSTGGLPGNDTNAGATAVMGPDVTLEAIPKTGATIDSESGRPLAAMIAAALGIPVTMLLADPGQVGSRATAETLDRPTQLEMGMRRAMWADVFRQILGYVVVQAVKAPRGPLSGTVTRDPVTGQETVALTGDVDQTIEVVWPPLDETPMVTIVQAIKTADDTGKLPPIEVTKLLLHALGVDDVDEIIDGMTDADGNWIDPYATVGQAVGNAATAAFRRGEDPAAAVA
ncbi:hypothetical protein ACFT5B_06905 [Luteimicrobium sp. NPDC057192]|uniref:hypothetical protein n=1 Tax=Luteimicrobium sp. NPDC057192 TaxID=3346042 RepID=UPI003626646D